MKIKRLRTAHLGGSSTCLKIETDDGVVGYSEPSVETSPEAVLTLLEKIGDEYLIGKHPFEIEKHRRYIQDALWYDHEYTARAAIAGIENALLDLKARALGVPLFELLGGTVRDQVRIYKWIGAEDRSTLPEQAKARKAEGLTGIKFSPTPNHPGNYPHVLEEVESIVSQVREAVGPDIDIMLDPASRWKLAEARHILKILEPYHILFAEDFIPELQIESLEKLSQSTVIPTAVGDRMIGFRDFEPLITHQAVAVIQPDICHSGGLSELKAISRLAEQHGIRVAPHNPEGPIATAIAIHLDLTIPNFLIQEIAGTDFFGAWSSIQFIQADEYNIQDGYIKKPTKPGLGIDIDNAVFDQSRQVPPAPRFWNRSDFHVSEW